MATPKIEIRIAGTIHSGRTGIALLIQDFLANELGIIANVQGSDETPTAIAEKWRRHILSPEGRDNFLSALREKKVKVEIIDTVPLPERKSLSNTQVLLQYAKGHLVPYDRREVEEDLAVLFSHQTLVAADYFTRSKQGQRVMIMLLFKAFYELRGGKISQQENLDLLLAHRDWLGDRTISTLLGFFELEPVLDDEKNVILTIEPVEAKLQEALRLARSVRDVQRVSEQQGRSTGNETRQTTPDFHITTDRGPYLPARS